MNENLQHALNHLTDEMLWMEKMVTARQTELRELQRDLDAVYEVVALIRHKLAQPFPVELESGEILMTKICPVCGDYFPADGIHRHD